MMELFQKIPLPVMYLGLAAFFLAPIIAGICKRSTTVSLMLFLRLAIGWHFLFEGVHKIHLEHVGVTETSKPFNSAVYFENSEGPLAPAIRKFIGDPDEKIISRLTVPAGSTPPAGFAEAWKQYAEDVKTAAGYKSQIAALGELIADPAQVKDKAKNEEAKAKLEALDKEAKLKLPETFAKLPSADDAALPANLVKDWNDYSARFQTAREASREKVKPEDQIKEDKANEEEKAKVEAKIKENKANLLIWLHEVRDVKKPTPGGNAPVDVSETVAQSVADLQRKIDKLKAATAFPPKLSPIGPVADKTDISTLQADVRSARTDLKKELDEKTTKFKDDLGAIVKPRLSDARKAVLEDEPKHDNLYWMNFATRWGLTAIGIGLLLGFFTRLACIGGAVFLLNTYLVDTPFPWLPVSPKSEGNYLFVNKNLVEMLALLVLASTKSGRWMGLDALVHRMRKWMKILLVLVLAGAFFWFVVKPAM